MDGNTVASQLRERGKNRSSRTDGQEGTDTKSVRTSPGHAANGFCGGGEEVSVDDMDVAYAAALGRTELIARMVLGESSDEVGLP
jgi:hypothetical protein